MVDDIDRIIDETRRNVIAFYPQHPLGLVLSQRTIFDPWLHAGAAEFVAHLAVGHRFDASFSSIDLGLSDTHREHSVVASPLFVEQPTRPRVVWWPAEHPLRGATAFDQRSNPSGRPLAEARPVRPARCLSSWSLVALEGNWPRGPWRQLS
jgi:hypothetical protein